MPGFFDEDYAAMLNPQGAQGAAPQMAQQPWQGNPPSAAAPGPAAGASDDALHSALNDMAKQSAPTPGSGGHSTPGGAIAGALGGMSDAASGGQLPSKILGGGGGSGGAGGGGGGAGGMGGLLSLFALL